MKFHFENLGLLGDSEMEIADLTIICGENNTGKTYATYAVYGFLRSWRRLLQLSLSTKINEIVRETGAYQFDLNEIFSGKINEYLKKMGARYVDQLPRVFAANKTYFEGAKVIPSIEKTIDFNVGSYKRTIKDGPAGKILATLSKETDSSRLNVLIADDGWAQKRYGGLVDFIADAMADIVFSPYLPDVFIASAERTGAAIFRRELDVARTRMIEALSSIDSNEIKNNPFKLLEHMDAGYAWPVQDNVDFVRRLEDIEKETGSLALEHPEIIREFESIIGGSYKVIKDIGLVYQPKGASKIRFTMSESSSCVRALLDIGFYLRCKAKSGDIFIVDEPELNLHPKNQRAFARLLSRLVNAGLKVFITTHSDYIIKEINTLIMLSQGDSHSKKMQSHFKYDDSELLDSSKINLYMTHTELRKGKEKGARRTKVNTLKKAAIYKDRGIEVSTFDTTIEEMNHIQNEIVYGGEL